MYGTILVPVDGSEPSRRALGHALELADAVGATLHVLAVVEPSRGSLLFGVDEVEEINVALVDLVDAIGAESGRGDVEIRCDVRRGEPAYDVILGYAREADADLLVLSRRGGSTLPVGLFGSTTDRLARVAEVPVTLVPAE